jgi:hypothetical protein
VRSVVLLSEHAIDRRPTDAKRRRMVLADCPPACIRCARADFSSSSALGRPMCCLPPCPSRLACRCSTFPIPDLLDANESTCAFVVVDRVGCYRKQLVRALMMLASAAIQGAKRAGLGIQHDPTGPPLFDWLNPGIAHQHLFSSDVVISLTKRVSRPRHVQWHASAVGVALSG